MYLKIDNIKKSYGTGDSRVDVLKGINCGVNKGEICVLLGPSGSGKSTLLNILGGIDKADSGSVTIGEDKIENFNDKQLSQYRRKHLGYIFQSYNLVPNLTVRENIEVGAYLSDKPLPIDELIELLGLEAHKNKRPNQLSGGQQQRTSIGRAIVKNPDLLLCDEPTGALDYNTSKDINVKYGSTIVIVTHNVAISQMAHQVINLHDGRIRSDEKNNNRLAAELIEW